MYQNIAEFRNRLRSILGEHWNLMTLN